MIRDADFLAEVARMYYQQNLSQAEIAEKMYISRSKVSRLLQEALDKGVVEIIIHDTWERATDIEQQMLKRFELKDVRVLKGRGRSNAETLEGLGFLAAGYVDSLIEPNMVLGVSWGNAVYNTIKAFRPNKRVPIKVVQIFGGAHYNNPQIDGPDLVRQMATVYGGEYYYLHAPLYVANEEVRKLFLQQSMIIQTMKLAEQANVVLTGIGSLDPKVISEIWPTYLSNDALTDLRAKGAVGHMNARLYDVDGKILNIDLHNGIIGLELECLRRIEHVIAVAGSEFKAEAILGALRGKYLNVLITDDAAAYKLLFLDSYGRPKG